MWAKPHSRSVFSIARDARGRAMTPLGLRRGALLLLHARGLALQVAEEVELGATHLGATHEVDLFDRRRMQREDALDALAERHLANGERRAGTATVLGDDHALEH